MSTKSVRGPVGPVHVEVIRGKYWGDASGETVAEMCRSAPRTDRQTHCASDANYAVRGGRIFRVTRPRTALVNRSSPRGTTTTDAVLARVTRAQRPTYANGFVYMSFYRSETYAEVSDEEAKTNEQHSGADIELDSGI